MSLPASCEILVVGAGPAGSALAASLARAGRDVLLVEARRHPRAKTCAEYASPRIAEELARLDLAAGSWRAAAIPLTAMRVIVDGAAFDIGYTDRRGRRMAWGVDRSELDALLARHAVALGAELHERVAFERPIWRDGRVTGAVLRDADGTHEVACRWLVGADGTRSRVARGVGVARPVRAPRRLGLVARYEAAPDLDGHGEMHVGPGFYIGLAPVPGGQLNVGMALPMPRDGERAAAEGRFSAAIEALPAVASRLQGLRRLTPIRGAAPIGQRVTAAAGPGWLLIGDAAGFIDPFTGEGIYRAMRSARVAADALAAPDDRVAAEYRDGRRAAFAAKDALTWVVQGMLAAPPVLAYAARRLADRPAAAAVLGSALGDCRPATDALAPRRLAEVFRP
jgi:menaquinone-9 beta-reductase